MAFIGELNPTNFIEQSGFTDSNREYTLPYLETENEFVKYGDYIYQLVRGEYKSNLLNKVVWDATEYSEVNHNDIYILPNKNVMFYNDWSTELSNTQPLIEYDADGYPVINDYTTGLTNCIFEAVDGIDNTVILEAPNQKIYHIIKTSADDKDGNHYDEHYFIKPDRIDINIQKMDNDDNYIETVYVRKYMFSPIDLSDTNLVNMNSIVEMKEGQGLYHISYNDDDKKVITLSFNSKSIKTIEIFNPVKYGTTNELKPFDNYYSIAKCTDYTDVYYKVRATYKSNAISLGNLISDTVIVEQYRDGDKIDEIVLTPDNRQDIDMILPKIPKTIIGKLDIIEEDVLVLKFSGQQISIGNIETAYMVDDGLTRFDFSVNFINYNQIKEEFGEIELGNKPIVGRTILTNVHKFEDAGMIYSRYKNLMRKFVVYDPFDAFNTGKAMDWVVRAFVENAPIKTRGSDNELPSTIEVGLNIREII